METTNLTELELEVIKAYDNADEFDDMPCYCFEDLVNSSGLTAKTLRGVLSSLLQKSIISEGEYPNRMKAYYLLPR